MKKITAAVFSVLCWLFPCIAFADNSLPEKGIARIQWSIKNCGPMPKIMLIGLIAIAAMIIITVLTAKYFAAKEDDKNEQPKK